MKKIIYLILILIQASCCKDNSYPKEEVIVIPPILSPSSSLNDFTDISFSDDNNGIISGSYGYLAKTKDGGKTWTKLTVGTNQSLLACFILNAEKIFTSRIGIFGSHDGGFQFGELSNLSQYSNSIFDIHFMNSNEGVIIKGKTILKTIDAGASWQIKSEDAEYLSQLEFKSNQVGYASGGTTRDGVSRGEIFKTINSGETWTKILNSNSEIMAMSFVNDQIGFYTNFSKEIFKTIDGGVSWARQGSISDLPLSTRFINEKTGYISTNEGKLYKTMDQGQTWIVIYDKTKDPISKITSTKNQLFAVGNQGLILKINF